MASILGFLAWLAKADVSSMALVSSTIGPLCDSTCSNLYHLSNPEAILARLRGQKVQLHGLRDLYAGWPSKTNPNLEQLRLDVKAWLER